VEHKEIADMVLIFVMFLREFMRCLLRKQNETILGSDFH